MPSNTRHQLESWLKTIRVETDSVLDVGGLFLPMKGRTKTWKVNNYKILDVKKSRGGVTADFIHDINFPLEDEAALGIYDIVFFIETLNHVYDPVTAMDNVNHLLRLGGLVYLSVHFVFPHHTGVDCLRYTRTGIQKILEVTGFRLVELVPKRSVQPEELTNIFNKESKVVKYPGEVGYLIKAQKIHGHFQTF